jgi:DNA-binding NtrC family response regulator
MRPRRRTDKPRLLVIDDDPGLCEALTTLLEDEFQVATAATGAEGLTLLAQTAIPVVLLDLRLPDLPGLEVLAQLKALAPTTQVLMLTVITDLPVVVEALRYGACDYLAKPSDIDYLRARVRVALAASPQYRPARLPVQVPTLTAGPCLIGLSAAMRRTWEAIRGVADTTSTVLLLGETGTGKELFAQALHAASPRQTHPFVTVNCATLAPTLVLSQLFGHERGAFTGAERSYVGCFERAHTGTLFLDEIGSLALEVQGVLLRVLQERRIQRVGSEQTLGVDVRIVAATNQPLRELVWTRAFRADLFYRLNVVPIELPPLRRRRVDMPLLLTHFLHKYNTAYGRHVQGFTAGAVEVLRRHAWPGNVRELEHLCARLIAVGLYEQTWIPAEAIEAVLAESLPPPQQPGS